MPPTMGAAMCCMISAPRHVASKALTMSNAAAMAKVLRNRAGGGLEVALTLPRACVK